MSLLCKITKGILHACRQRARASPNLGLNAQKPPSSKRRHAARRHMIVKVLPQSLQRTSRACQQTNMITNLIYQPHQGRDCAAMRISPKCAAPRQWHYRPSLPCASWPRFNHTHTHTHTWTHTPAHTISRVDTHVLALSLLSLAFAKKVIANST